MSSPTHSTDRIRKAKKTSAGQGRKREQAARTLRDEFAARLRRQGAMSRLPFVAARSNFRFRHSDPRL